MKTIFIATDFTETSYNAVKYGFCLADVLKSRVVLFHVYKTAVSIPEAYAVVTSEELRIAAEKELNRLSNEYKINSNLPVVCLAVEGDTDELILKYANKHDDCLIVCGRKNSGKFIQKWFGNTIVTLINKSNIPLLVVPEGYEFKKIKKMVFATDLSLDTDIRTLSPLLDIGEKNDSKLIVLRVMGMELNVVEEINYRSDRLNSFLNVLEPHYKFIKSENISGSIEKYLEENNADMVSLMPRQHNIFEKIFEKSESKKMLFLSKLPILYLPEIKIKTLKEENEKQQVHA